MVARRGGWVRTGWAARVVITTGLLIGSGGGGMGGDGVAGPGLDLLPVGGLAITASAQTTTAAQDEFVPIDQLPEEDRLPAAPFLVAAYTVALVLLVGYVWLLWRRLGTVQQELRAVRAAQPRDRASGG
jgi:hypothetical protein